MKHFNIPIFVPHLGCPFDCIFCNQHHITGSGASVGAEDVRTAIETQLSTIPREGSFIEAAFFGGSFTGIDNRIQEELLAAAYEYIKSGDIDGIRVSTRPDYINDESLSRLLKYHATSIELGVQSMDDGVLRAAGRGHTSADAEIAVSLIRKYPFKLGLQMMTGLPEDTHEKAVSTAKKIIALSPDFVRIYPTLVVKDTYLEKMYRNGEYTPQTLEESVLLCKEIKKLFDNVGIEVIRIALMTTDEISPGGSLVAGPFHNSFRELVDSAIYYDKIRDAVCESEKSDVVIAVNDREVSKAVGNKRENINRIYTEFNIKIKVKGDSMVSKGELEVK